MRRLAALLLSLAAAPAFADGQPVTVPTRDVDITYRLPGPNPADQRVRWQAATGKERIDPPAPGLHLIIDPRAHRFASVRDAEKLAMEIDQTDIRPAAGAPPSATYVARGADTVAGLACTVWQAAGGGPLLCFTADGVLLRVVAEGRVVAEAVRVTFAPADPADFVVPPDYRRVVRQTSAPNPATPNPAVPGKESQP